MFTLAIKPTFSWPVKFSIPVDDTQLDVSFTAKFLRISQEELDTRMPDDERVRKVLTGWEEVADEAGKPMEFNPENLDKVLNVPGMRMAIALTYYQAMSGAAREKN